MAIKTSANDIVFMIKIAIVIGFLGGIYEGIGHLARYLDGSVGINTLTWQIIIYCFLGFIILYYFNKKYTFSFTDFQMYSRKDKENIEYLKERLKRNLEKKNGKVDKES
jgi:hypothetical protein